MSEKFGPATTDNLSSKPEPLHTMQKAESLSKDGYYFPQDQTRYWDPVHTLTENQHYL